MEIDSEILVFSLLGLLTWAFILFLIIKWAVYSAFEKEMSALENEMKTQNSNLIILNRLLIKQLLKQGYSKKELIELHNQDTKQFWDSIEGAKE